MVNSKKIGIAGAAVVLVTLVTIFGASYMSDFENPRSSIQDESKTHELQHAPVLGSETATVTIIEVGDYQCHMCKLWFEKTRPFDPATNNTVVKIKAAQPFILILMHNGKQGWKNTTYNC